MVAGGHEGVHLGSVFLSGGGGMCRMWPCTVSSVLTPAVGHIFSRALAVKLADAAESFVKEWLGA